ncbi:MAG: helical backbone metal receptor [Bacteroidia bacterium]|nr:helical backbone metal receptor [Bacteroidia bacterium]MDW8089112.1 helical backbone metal receptor [Bacteroidia bacterium]
MRSVTDSLGRTLLVPEAPQRILCLCPSLTETLFALGLEGKIVGRTRYCIHPADKVRHLPVVGGTKKIDLGLVRELAPDLIIAEKEENTKADVEALSAIAPVFVTNVENYEDALQAIRQLGDLTGACSEAEALVEGIERAFAQVSPLPQPRRVLYLIWREPFMAAGQNTYINSLLERLNLVNEALFLEGRYPIIEEPSRLHPHFIFLSSEPYPFSEKHIPEVQRLWPHALIHLVRGDYFSWYGVRMLEAAPYFRQLVERLAKSE